MDDELATRKDKQAIAAGTATVYSGTPALVHFLKIFGAWPSSASEYNVLDAAYKYAFPHDHADNKIRKLMNEGKPSMPKFWMPITHGLAAAPAEPADNAPSRRSSLLEQRMPTAKTPTM
jgi:hypothetical protein